MSLALSAKDLRLITGLADTVGVAVPVTEAVLRAVESACAHGLAAADMAAMSRLPDVVVQVAKNRCVIALPSVVRPRGVCWCRPRSFLRVRGWPSRRVPTERPTVIRDVHGERAIAIRSLVQLALTCDPAVLDGAAVGRILARVRRRLEADIGLDPG